MTLCRGWSPFAPGTSSIYRAAQDSTAPLAEGSGLVHPQGSDIAAHMNARPPAPSHLQRASQEQRSSELSRGLLSQLDRGLVRNKPSVLAKEAIQGKVNCIKN